MKRFFDWFNNLYPLWLVTLAVIAFFKPPVMLWFAALVLQVIGFGIGYLIPKVLRYPESVARTVSIEVGMQNGGMAASLARLHFASMPLAAAAGVFSGVMQNIIGGIAAAIWKRRPPCA
jgi:bile acid:Na+ symporter, BASS family